MAVEVGHPAADAAVPGQGPRAIDLPFPPRVSPERGRAAAHSRAWAQRMGMAIDSDTLRIHHECYDFSAWAAYAFCDLVGTDLDLVSDLATWFGYFDDSFDGPLGCDADRVRQFVARAIAVLDSADPVPPAHPVLAALADLWSREHRGMSPVWRARAAANWSDYLAVHIAESANRRNRVIPTVDAYLTLRDVSGVVWVILDFAESVGHYEIPPEILQISAMQAMRRITVRVSSVVQDLLSLGKEETMGDPNNLVLVMEHHDGMSRQEAIDHIHAMLRAQTDAFLSLEAAIPRALDQLAIPPEHRAPVYRHIADMRTIMRGTQDFCQASARYRLSG